MLTEATRTLLCERALRVREHIIRLTVGGGCFVGAALSCADLLVYLYSRGAHISPALLDSRDRDYILLSKGHAVPALYGTLVELEFFPAERLKLHLSTEDSLYWHPNRALPGVEFHSGSLGHMLGVGAGIACAALLDGRASKVFVILGDGELNEGSIWEAFLFANAQKLSNLIVIIDRNEIQANFTTEELIPLEPLKDKLISFGFVVTETRGHDFDALEEAFSKTASPAGHPSAIIAHTIRGKGIPSIEKRPDRWFVNLSEEESLILLKELAENTLQGGTSV
jgi:transketolase